MSTIDQLLAAAPSTRIQNEPYSLEYDDQGASGTIQFWVAGSELAAFRATACGLSQTISYPGGITASRVIPLQHWDYINAPNCFADSVRISPVTNTRLLPQPHPTEAESILHEYYHADVHFRTRKWTSDSTFPWITESWEGGGDAVTRPGTAYYFPSDGLKINHDVGVIVPTLDFSLTFSQLPSSVINMGTYSGLMGKLNDAVFYTPLGPSSGYAIGTVMYMGPSVQGSATIGGVVTYSVSHRFRWRYIGHNVIMRGPGTGGTAGFEAPVDGSGDYIYQLGTLDALYA